MAFPFVFKSHEFNDVAAPLSIGSAPTVSLLLLKFRKVSPGVLAFHDYGAFIAAVIIPIVAIIWLLSVPGKGSYWDEQQSKKTQSHNVLLTYVQTQRLTSLNGMIAFNDRPGQMAQIRALIHTFARRYDVNPQLVAGIVFVESSGNPFAVRFEPKFYDKVKSLPQLSGYMPKHCTDETERVFRSTSFGLMQIMGETSRIRGYRGEFLTGLLDIETNLDMGVAFFAELMKRTDDPRVALFWYNAGPAAKYPGVKPNDYPSKVLAAIENGLTAGLA